MLMNRISKSSFEGYNGDVVSQVGAYHKFSLRSALSPVKITLFPLISTPIALHNVTTWGQQRHDQVTYFVFNANSAKFPVSTTVVGIPASLAAISTLSLALFTGI